MIVSNPVQSKYSPAVCVARSRVGAGSRSLSVVDARVPASLRPKEKQNLASSLRESMIMVEGPLDIDEVHQLAMQTWQEAVEGKAYAWQPIVAEEKVGENLDEFASLDFGFYDDAMWKDNFPREEFSSFLMVASPPRDDALELDANGNSPTTLPKPPSTVSPPANTRHVCSQCSLTFDTGDLLEIHAIDSQHKSFVCAEQGCGKAYSRRDAKVRHEAKHRLPSRHTCPLCQAEFARKDHLRRHTRVQHAGEIPRPHSAPRVPSEVGVDIRKVKESEPALRRSLSPENLAIKMLDIVGQFENTEEGVGKAFACVVACAALNAPQHEALTPRTKRRLMSVQAKSAITSGDLPCA